MHTRSDHAVAWAMTLAPAGASLYLNLRDVAGEPDFVRVAAAVGPVALVLAVEGAKRGLLGRWTVALLGLLASGAFALSFSHVWHLLGTADGATGQPWARAVVAAVLDGLTVCGLVALALIGRTRTQAATPAGQPDVHPDATPDTRADAGQPQASTRTPDVRPVTCEVAALDAPRPRAVRTVVALPDGADPVTAWLTERGSPALDAATLGACREATGASDSTIKRRARALREVSE
jgi:hypothetical protein